MGTHDRQPRSIATRARDAFRLTGMAVAVLAKPLAELGLVGDAFVGVAAALGTIPAILLFSAFVLYVIYGMMLCVWVAIVLVTGLANILTHRATGRVPRHLR